MRTVIFDLDGTLADTSGDLIAAANACFQHMGAGDMLDPVADALTAFHGGRAMLRLGFSRLEGGVDEVLVDREYPRLIEFYGANINVHTRLYPGVVSAIDRLHNAGYATGICTNKPSASAERLLKELGVRHLFASLIGADTLPVRKPDPAPYRAAVERAFGRLDRSLLIGDTETDYKTARAADVPIVLVSFGPEGDSVERFGPDALLDDYAGLGTVVKDLIG